MESEEIRELRANLHKLKQEHRDLDSAINALEESGRADQLQLKRLKKKKLFLKDETLPIVPEGGFEKVDSASAKAIRLLEWRSKQWNLKIQHAGNGREKKIGNYRVDGFIEAQNKVIEFLGCAYHVFFRIFFFCEM